MPMPLAAAAAMVPHSPSRCAIFCIAIGATSMGQLHVRPARRPYQAFLATKHDALNTQLSLTEHP